jgi:O-methyltransferase
MSVMSRIRHRIDVALLSVDAKRVRDEGLTYLGFEKLGRLERALKGALKATDVGDVLEFGVALGGSAVLLAKQARKSGRRFAGFDVFGMIPPPTSEKDDQKSKERYQVIASGQSKGIAGAEYYGYRSDLYSEVCETFKRYGVPADGAEICLVKGLFEETWPIYLSKAVAFAHIDCDWYDPVKYCLEVVADKMLPGGAIVLDDYNDYGGCKTATDEFLSAHKDYVFHSGVNPILQRV